MANNSRTREEEVKNRIRDQFFQEYDATPVIGDIDFAVTLRQNEGLSELFDREYFLWAEAKAGTKEDILASFVQLIITIGKARTHEKLLPPRFLGAFDEEKIAFIEFHNVMEVFYQNDFNWNVTPSNHETREFHYLYDLLHDQLSREISLFDYKKDEKDLRRFIRSNFKMGKKRTSGINITKNNYLFVFQRWVEEVKPSIAVNWDDVPKTSVVDFFYADLISRNDYTLREELAVVLRGDHYKILQDFLSGGTPLFSEASFNDKMAAYRQFWNKYNRPPRHEYLDIILKRRDLLIPQDLRRYQGAFFTPPQWVQKSQEYLAEELGEDWQQNYYVWDCCAGTGNLLYGLTEPYRIWASTLDDADVQVMKERIKEKSLDLLERHVFQFDFLNDSFDKLPGGLRNIINDPEKRKHLVIYINPPYAEAGEIRQLSGTSKNKTDVAVKTQIYQKYLPIMGIAGRELFAQFMIRIYNEIPSSVLANFSTLKNLQAPNFRDFRRAVRAKPERLFLVPASSFDNVSGKFPIGFYIWDFSKLEFFESIEADVFLSDGTFAGKKTVCCYDNEKGVIGKWVLEHKDDTGKRLGFMSNGRNDFQNQKLVYLMNKKEQMPTPRGWWVTPNNLIVICIFLAVRHSIEATWLNDRDQFLYPNNSWNSDEEFKGDCFAFTLFSNSNNIQSRHGINHWIPFSEEEVGAQDSFDSHFMHDFITGKAHSNSPQPAQQQDLFGNPTTSSAPQGAITFSAEAQAVMDAGRELWRYYHSQEGANPNASYYDIRLHFQGTKTTAKGKEQMNTESSDPQYTALLSTLRQRMKQLAEKIQPKVYEYGFLKR